jgi:hypothetical protein
MEVKEMALQVTSDEEDLSFDNHGVVTALWAIMRRVQVGLIAGTGGDPPRRRPLLHEGRFRWALV